MSNQPNGISQGFVECKTAFDQSFRLMPEIRPVVESAVQIRVGSEIFAVRTCHIAGVIRSRKVVPLPSLIPELLGVAAVRDSLVPVYGLAALLGIPPAASEPSWLLLVPGDTTIGLAFDGFEGQQAVNRLTDAQHARDHVLQLADTASGVRAVLDIPGLTDAIRKRAGTTEPPKEIAQ